MASALPKKRRFSSTSDDEQLPQSFEILEQIFMQIPGELNNLKETSRRFYQVIINSLPLMKRCNLKWSRFSADLVESPMRKFCNVEFYGDQKQIPSLMKFIEVHHPTLYEINFRMFRFKNAENLHRILSLVAGTLKEFLSTAIIEDYAKLPQITLSKLESLTLNETTMEMFKYTGDDSMILARNLKRICFYGSVEETVENKAGLMVEFLRSSTQLEELELSNLPAREVIAQSATAPFLFKLKKLSLKMYYLKTARETVKATVEFVTPNLPRFLESQQNSLIHLNFSFAVLQSVDISTILTMQIKHLEIHSCRFIWDNDDLFLFNETIETFIFRHQRCWGIDSDPLQKAVENILFNGRALRSIDFIGTSFYLPWSLCLSENEVITNLKLENCSDLWALTFPSLETLEVVKSDFTEREVDEVLQLVLLNNHLKKINVPVQFQRNAFFMSRSNGLDIEFNDEGKPCVVYQGNN